MRLSLDNQTINFIPNSETGEVVDVLIYDKSKRKLVHAMKELEVSIVSHFYRIDFDVSLKEGENYIVEIYQGANIVYRGLAFATAQTDTYSINEGKYKEHPSNNEYIILDNE